MSNPGLHYRPSPQFVTTEPEPSRLFVTLEVLWMVFTAAACLVVPFWAAVALGAL